MKGIREIIERMQVLLVLHDRVIWENAFSEGCLHTMKERIHQQQIENDWINRNNLDRIMNQNDRNNNQELANMNAGYVRGFNQM